MMMGYILLFLFISNFLKFFSYIIVLLNMQKISFICIV